MALPATTAATRFSDRPGVLSAPSCDTGISGSPIAMISPCAARRVADV
jgi:hypothetical protein